MASQPEAKFKRKLIEAFDTLYPDGWRAFLKAVAKDGVPDLRFVIPGHVGVWVEAKVDDNPPSPAQMLQASSLRAAGDRMVFLRCVGWDRPKDRRALEVGYPHNGDVYIAYRAQWADLRSAVFWAQLSFLGNAL